MKRQSRPGGCLGTAMVFETTLDNKAFMVPPSRFQARQQGAQMPQHVYAIRDRLMVGDPPLAIYSNL